MSLYDKGLSRQYGGGVILKQKDYIEDPENLWGPDPHEELYDYSKVKETDMGTRYMTTDGILAAITMTNNNLLNMHERLKGRFTINQSKGIILQSEALAIFKGNIIKAFKQVFGSTDINRVKSSMMLSLDIDTINPIILSIGIQWAARDYTPSSLECVQQTISRAFKEVSSSDINQIAYDCVRTHQEMTRTKTASIPAQLRTDIPKVKSEEISSVSDINFDSITKIKFKVK